MSIEHKAFVFNYDKFTNELSNILAHAISENECNNLIVFIENNLPYLKEPYEGENLDLSWRELIEVGDVNEYGDFAITKYYDPKNNIGLGYAWEKINDELLQEFKVDVSLLLGIPFG